MLKLVFRAPYIPPNLTDELNADANKALQQIFNDESALKKAIAQNKNTPQPHDELSTAIGGILHAAQDKVTRQCGPSAACHLHPYFINEPD